MKNFAAKPWFLSKGVLGSLMVAAGVLLQGANVRFGAAEQQAAMDMIYLGWDLVGAGLALWGRISAKRPLKLTGGKAVGMMLVLGLVAGGLAGCAGWQDNQDFKSWQNVNEARYEAWENVMAELAQNPRMDKITVEPIDPTKPANARVVAELSRPEPRGTWEAPPVSNRPKSTGELVADVAKSAPKEFVAGVLGYVGIKEGGETMREAFRSGRSNTTINGSFNPNRGSSTSWGGSGVSQGSANNPVSNANNVTAPGAEE